MRLLPLSEASKKTQFKCKPELKEAIKLAGKMAAKDIAAKFGLSERSVRAYASRVGVSLQFCYLRRPSRKWTYQEIITLKKLASTKTAAQVV